MSDLHKLPDKWRKRAASIPHALASELPEECADELEAALAAHTDHALLLAKKREAERDEARAELKKYRAEQMKSARQKANDPNMTTEEFRAQTPKDLRGNNLDK